MPANHHDALIKLTFSRAEDAAPLLRGMLPAALAARIDWPSLTVVPGSFVDDALKDRHSDLLFTVRLSGAPSFVYLLFEHQSTRDPLMAYRLLVYLVRAWEAFLKNHTDAERLPAILPLVLHHSEDGWKSSTHFESLLDLDAEALELAGPFVPRFRFLLDDISHESGEALRARAITALDKLILWCLRNARTPDEIVRSLREWSDVVREVRDAPHGAAALTAVWRYIVLISRRPPEETVNLLLEAIPQETDSILTAGEQLIERGRQEGLARGRKEGRQEGRQEGQAGILLKLLQMRFGTLSEEVIAKVRAADFALLAALTERVLTARTLAEAFGSRSAPRPRRGRRP